MIHNILHIFVMLSKYFPVGQSQNIVDEFNGQLHVPVVNGHINPAVSLHWRDELHEVPYDFLTAFYNNK